MSTTAVQPCSKIVVDTDRLNRLPYYERVHRGIIRDGVKVLFTVPSVCVLTPTTQIEFSEYTRIETEELRKNVLLKVIRKNGIDYYVYPKEVYREIRKLYIDKMIHGEKPFTTGLILAGAPGTGKSTLATLIAKYVGIPTYYIDPTIISKWVGDTEKMIKNMIREARENQPSIIILDDAEWMMKPRSLAGGSSTEETDLKVMMTNIKNIMFKEMQDIANNRELVLFIATTNLKLTEIDPAFKRGSRFGNTLFIPLPDYEAVHTILSKIMGENKEIERYARMFVNMGLNMDDVIRQAERIMEGFEPKFDTSAGRGYKRIYTDIVEDFKQIFKYIPEEVMHRRSRIYIPMVEDVAVAIAVQLLYNAGRTAIHIVDHRYIEEAVHTANVTESGIIVSSLLQPAILDYIHKNAETPVFYVGETPPRAVIYHTLFDLETLRILLGGSKPLVKAVANMYGIKITDQLWKQIENTVSQSTQKLENLLKAMVTLGVIDNKILNLIKRSH